MEKWIVDGTEYEDSNSAAYAVTELMDNDAYNDMLDEVYGEVYIAGYSHDTSDALYCIDPIAYRVGMSDYYNSLAGDIEYSLDRMSDGDEEDFYGVTVEYVDEEDEDEDEDMEESLKLRIPSTSRKVSEKRTKKPVSRKRR